MDFFPSITPYSTGFLDAGHGHTLYWEQSGNPDGAPVVVLHGGPGAGATPLHRQFFDPDHYRIIIFDQRGSGRSHPLGGLERNTTDDLVNDIELLRKHLKVKKWHVFGGSWGSTLALHYAAAHPDRCKSMVLRAIFLCEQEEIDWFIYGMRTIFPEAWEQFAAIKGWQDGEDLLEQHYYSVLTGNDEDAAIDAAIRWSLYEGACSSLLPNYETISTPEQKKQALALARIEAHYFLHEVRNADNSILGKIDALRGIPSVIIQGRYDIICPIKTANKLHQVWPEADYIVVPDAGHSALDAPLRSRLIEATENFKTIATV